MSEDNTNYSQEMVIDRFEEKYAILKGAEGQEIVWPIKKLPDEIKKGEVIRLTLSTAKTETEEREKIAKALLNEILKSDEDK